MLLYPLKLKLYALWFALVSSALVTGLLLYQFYAQSSAVQLARVQADLAQSCESLTERYTFFVAGWSGPGAAGFDDALRRELGVVVTGALLRSEGVEGGIWSAGVGSLAYGFPTYEGTGPKTDLPAAEESSIARVNADAISRDGPVLVTRPGASQTLVLHACPLHGPVPGVSAWTMARVFTGRGPAYNQLLLGLGLLAATVLASALFLGHILFSYVRRLAVLERALAPHGPEGDLPILPLTGERELDGLVTALNSAGMRLGEAHRRILSTERLAAIGRVAAGVAHEIRNPLAAMRLRAENALVSRDPARIDPAFRTVIEQVDRLDGLLGDLLALTRPRPPTPTVTRIADLVAAALARHAGEASRDQVELRASTHLAVEATAILDAEQIGRALSILILGGIGACIGRPGACVVVETAAIGAAEDTRLAIRVTDDGVPLTPEEAGRAFEPFECYRAGAGSLGLAIVREIARAHGGDVRHVADGDRTMFELDVAWRRS